MRILFALVSILIISASVYAQSYSGGLPIPGLPISRGPKTMAGSTSVTMATDQGPIPISGTFTSADASITANYSAAASSSSLIAYIDEQGRQHPFLGDQNGITVTALQGTNPWVTSRNWILSGLQDSVAVTGTVAATQSGVWNLNNITGTVTLPTGAATEATLAATGVTVSAIDAKLPATLGQKVSAQSLAVVIASDQSTIGVTGTVSSIPVTVTASTISRVANSVASQTLLNANGSRKQIFLYNDSSATNCYVKFGATASLVSFTIKLFATDTYIMDPPVYTGQIDYICDAASGSMEVNEQ